jgi:hypothetical protein
MPPQPLGLNRLRRLLLLLLLACCCPGAHALTESLEIWAVDGYTAVALVGFGFDEGGSYELAFEITKADDFEDLSDYTDQNSTLSDTLLAAVCTDSELRTIKLAEPSKGQAHHVLTPPCDMSVCSRMVRFDQPTLVMESSVDTREYLTFVVASCGLADVRGKVSYTLLNPGGQHLGTDLAPLPTVYLGLVGGWTLVLLLWLTNLCKFRNHNVMLQRALTFVPVAKFISVVLRAVYFQTGAATGDLPSSIMYFSYIVYILYKAAFFTSLLLIAKGWLISRPVLDESEKRSVRFFLL